MDQHDVALCQYLELALISHHKKQLSGRDRLLFLAGAAACRAGLPDIADQCRELIIANNSQHLTSSKTHFYETLQQPEGQTLAKQLERQIPFEQAELLLARSSKNRIFDNKDALASQDFPRDLIQDIFGQFQ